MFRVLQNRTKFSLPYKLLKMAQNNISGTSKYNSAVEELEKNPFYGKYANKIAVMQQFTPEEFEEKITNLVEAKKPTGKEVSKERPYSIPTQAKPIPMTDTLTKNKKLSDIMKTELLINKSGDEIKQLWLDYHKNKDVITGVIPQETYKTLHKRGMEFSTFLLPVPRSEGYEFIVLQFVDHEVHFTPLIGYQTHKENSPECLTITHYPELAEEKGIVLMKGEYDPNILNCQEAQCLANELQLYYSQNSENRLELLKKFTFRPNEFKHGDLIKELETLTIK